MDDTHFGRIDAENFVRDLRQCRLHALAVRMHANPEFEPPVRCHSRGGLFVSRHHRNAPAGIDRGAVRGLFAIDGKANADQAPIGFPMALALAERCDVDCGDGAPHGFRIIAAVEMLAGDVVERHFFGLDQIAQPHLAGLKSCLPGHGIEHDLQRETDASPCYAAIGKDRAFVGRDRICPAAIGRHAVGPRQDAGDLRGFETGRKR
jgi:hypothetical protein